MAQRTTAHIALGRAIRTARHAQALSQEELGFRSGLHRTYVGGIERGERNPSFGGLRQVADALDVPVSALLAEGEKIEDGLDDG